MNAIEMNNLSKNFGSIKAVASINLEIREGEIFGLLGPNGAGKTTTISMLATIVNPTSGSATVNGFDLKKQDDVRRSIGIVFQDPSLDDELTGWENLDFHGRLYHMKKSERDARIKEVLGLVELSERADSLVKTYSGGMRRRLEIARGLMHRPKILFLDEPTLGLDPQTRRKIWEYVQSMNRQERTTIVLTTHYMEEADYLCNRIAIIDNGKIIALDTPYELKNMLGGDIIVLEVSDTEKMKTLVSDMQPVVVDGKINITAKEGDKLIPKLIETASANGVSVVSANIHKPTLEDVFIHYTGRKIREEETGDKERFKDMLKQHGRWR